MAEKTKESKKSDKEKKETEKVSVKKKDKKRTKEVKKPDSEKEKKVKKTSKKVSDSGKNTAKSKLELLKKKAKELEAKVEEKKDVDIRGVVLKEEEKKETLVPIDDYLKSSIHLGTKVITPHMRKYVYRRRADGLAVFNTALLDDKIREGAEYIAQFPSEQIVVVCKREAGWDAVKIFCNLFGIKNFTKKYPAGSLTNTAIEDFFEKELLVICDPWLDKNALSDANKIKMKVLGICDTNNLTFGIDKVIPGNNKSAKSLGMIFYLLSKIYAEKRKIDVEIPPITEFIEDWENMQIPK